MPGISYAQMMGAGPEAPQTLSYDDLRALIEHAGVDPKFSGIMARIALSESGGNPSSNASGKTSYQENGRTYYPQGLWQISTIHGYPESQFSILNNASRAAELFNEQGFAPWEASRFAGAGGGWGQYLPQELGLPPGAKTPRALVGLETLPTGGGGMTYQQMMAAGASPAPSGGGESYQQMMQAGPEPSATPSGGGLTYQQMMQAGPGPQATPGGLPGVAGRINKDIRNVLSNQPVERGTPVAQAEAALRLALEKFARGPMTGMFDILGTSQRLSEEAITGEFGKQFGEAGQAFEKGDLKGAFGHIWGLVGRVDDHYQDQLTQQTEQKIHEWIGLPTHLGIDKWVNTFVPKDLRGPVASILKGVEDFGVTAAIDPLTYTGIGEIGHGLEIVKLVNVLNPLFAGGRLAHYAYAAAKALGIGKMFAHLGPLGDLYDHTIGALGRNFHEYFTVRPDLDKLSPDMKKVRMQREASGEEDMTRARTQDQLDLRNATPEQARKIYERHMEMHGGYKKFPNPEVNMNDFVERYPGETDDELYARRNEILDSERDDALKKRVTAETKEDIKKWGVQKPTVIGGREYNDAALDVNKIKLGRDAQLDQSRMPGLAGLRDLMRKSVIWNPLPHGVKNVGELAYLAGGPTVIPRAFKYAATGLSVDQIARLRRIGAAPFYSTLEHTAGTAMGRFVFGKSGAAMSKFEGYWRQSLLDILDKRFPVPKDAVEAEKLELLKGAMINEKLGDYRNQNAFVRMLEAMGGPFVAFRMGIVPRNIVQAMQYQPGRVLAILRAQFDINQARAGGQRNELEMGGPVPDAVRLLTNPVRFLQQTIFPEETILPEEGAPYTQEVLREAEQFVPGVGTVADVANAWAYGRSMPTGPHSWQKMSLGDKIAATVLASLGMYFHRTITQKYWNRLKSQYRKEGL